MADGNITLKLDFDSSQAKSSIQDFGNIAQKAINSADTKVQKLGLNLQNTTNKMSKLASSMSELANKRVPTTEYSNLNDKIKQVSSQLKDARSSLSQFESTTLHTEQYDYISEEIKNIKINLENARDAYGQLVAEGKVDTEEFDGKVNEVIKYENQLKEAEQYQQLLTEAGQKYAHNSEFTTKQNEVKQLEIAYEELIARKREMETTGTATMSGTETAQYKDMANQMSYAQQQAQYMSNSIYTAASSANRMNNNLGKSRSTLDTVKNKVSGLIGKLRDLGNQSNSTSTRHNTSFKKMLTTVLKYGFGIRSIFLLYKKLRTVISTGLSEMSKQFSDVADDVYTLKNSWSGFKSSLVSAFQPIFSYVVPALSTLINYLTAAMNALANFFALLTGSSTYKKAVAGNESVADSVSGTGSAAEEANEELAEYDDLIVIDSDSSSGGSGGGGSSDSGAWNWEEVEVTSSSLADKLSDIWDVFKSAWETKGEDVINAAEYALSSIKSLASTVGDTFYRVFTEGYGYDWLVSCLGVIEQILLTIGDVATAIEEAWERNDNGYNLVVSIFEMWTAINDMIITVQESWRKAWNSGTGVDIVEDILQSVTNINNTIKNFAENFTTAWEKAGVGDSIMQTILDIVESITDFINDITEATEEWSESLDFYPLLESIDTILGSIKGIIDSIKTIAYYIYKNIILPISKKILESTLPDFIEEVADFIDEVKDNLDDIDWDSLTEDIGKVIDLALDVFLEGVKTALEDLKPLIPIIKEEFKALSTVLDFLTDEDTIEYFENLRDKINEIKSLLGMKSDKFSILDSTTVGTVLTKITNLYNILTKLKELITGEAWSTWGKDIRDGLLKDFANADTIEEKIRAFFKAVVAALKKVFGINSPAKEMYIYGEDILKGILTGFKNAFTNIATTIRELKDKIVSKIKEKFGDIKDKITESIGNFSIKSLLGIDEDSTVLDVITNITSTFAGGLTSLVDFETFEEVWGTIKTTFKNIKATITAKLSGIFSKITDISSMKEKVTDLWNSWKDKAADLKATLSGKISEITDLDTIKTKMANLRTEWANKAADFKATISGAIKHITDLDTWKSKMSGLRDTWKDKVADFKATLSGAISKITSLDDWKTKIGNLKSAWAGKTADFKTTFDKAQSTLDSWKTKISNLYSSWKGKTAEFSLKFSAAASDLKSWVNNNVINKINTQFKKVPILKNHLIPTLARGGIVDTATMFVAGEAGQEAVIPLERNLGWLDKMATMITDKLVDTPIPLIANGNILPITDAFMKSTIEVMDNSKIAQLLESILNRIDNLENSNNAPIMLQLDGRVVAEVVWDESKKLYKQTGIKYNY